jgi:hypothetical protein
MQYLLAVQFLLSSNGKNSGSYLLHITWYYLIGRRGLASMFYISFDAEQLWVLDSVPGEVKTDNSDGEVERVLQTLSLFCTSLLFPFDETWPSFLQD